MLALYTDLLDVSHVRVERWVGAAFGDVLHRPATGAGVADWVTSAETRGRPWVARTLTRSGEGISVWIRDRYAQLLGRSPAPDALARRTAAVRAGGTLADVVAALAGSDEAWRLAGSTDALWVDQLYRSVLGRPADAAATAHWTAALAGGADRPRVVRQVWASFESRRARVRGLYLDVVDRPADPGGLAFHADRLAATDDLVLLADLVASAERFLLAQA